MGIHMSARKRAVDNCEHRLVIYRKDINDGDKLAYCFGCEYELAVTPTDYNFTGARIHGKELYRLKQELQMRRV